MVLGLAALGLLSACRPGAQEDVTAEIVNAEPRPPVLRPNARGLPAPFDREATYHRTLHVHPDGDDSGGTGTPEVPFATVNRAVLAAVPGTRIVLAAGRHAPIGSIRHLRGEPGAPIAITGAEGSVIDGRLTDEIMAGLHLSNPSYVVIEGLTVENAYPHGIGIDDGGDYVTPAGPIILRSLVLRNIGRGKNNDCLKLSGVDDFQVLESEFENCDEGEAIDMVGCHRGFISGNTFRRTPLTAVQTKGGSSDIVIHGNRFIEVTARSVNMGGHTGDPYFRPLDAPYEAARIQVLSNIFYRSGDTAIAFTGCIECLAAHNTFIDPQGYVVRLLEEHPQRAVGRDGRFRRNLVLGSEKIAYPEMHEIHNKQEGKIAFDCNIHCTLLNEAIYSLVERTLSSPTNSTSRSELESCIAPLLFSNHSLHDDSLLADSTCGLPCVCGMRLDSCEIFRESDQRTILCPEH